MFVYFIFIFTLQSLTLWSSELLQTYEWHCKTPSDINEHIPILREMSYECSSVAEIGVRSLVSTWGILQGLSENENTKKSYLGIDVEKPPDEKLKKAKRLSREHGIEFTFWHVNDMHIQLEPTDMLFIDSLHTYCHLTYELETFSRNIGKYICLHDTSDPWGNQNDITYTGDYSEYPAAYDRTKAGLWPAVVDFLKKHPEWSLFKQLTSNHGFTILKRSAGKATGNREYHPDVDYYLKNKIVLCTGPALNNYEILKRTTEADMALIPFKKIFLSTNDRKNRDITFHNQTPVTRVLLARGKQLDCINCIITSLKNAVKDPEVFDDDIILFKHETVYINDMNLIKKGITKLLEGYNMIARSWRVRNSTRGTDAFLVRVSAIRKFIQHLGVVNNFTPEARFCEEYFTRYLTKKIRNVYDIPYCHSNGWFSELGFYHIPSAAESNRAPWNKKNYDKLFR